MCKIKLNVRDLIEKNFAKVIFLHAFSFLLQEYFHFVTQFKFIGIEIYSWKRNFLNSCQSRKFVNILSSNWWNLCKCIEKNLEIELNHTLHLLHVCWEDSDSSLKIEMKTGLRNLSLVSFNDLFTRIKYNILYIYI